MKRTSSTHWRTTMSLIGLVVLLTQPLFLGAQERTTIRWQGMTVEVAKDEIALKVKPGYSSSTLSNKLGSLGLVLVAEPDDMLLTRAQVPKGWPSLKQFDSRNVSMALQMPGQLSLPTSL